MSDVPIAPGVPAEAQAIHSHSNPGEDLGGALNKPGLGWVIFEWARNPYYILIIIYVFAPYFGAVIGAKMTSEGAFDHLPADEVATAAGAAGLATIASVTKAAGFVAALTAPFLGAALDRGGRRKPLLLIILSVLATMSGLLWFAAPDGSGLSIPMTMAVLVVASVSYTYSEVTHNAMLSVSGRPRALPMISGIGLGLGNLAATLLLIAIVVLFAMPDLLGWPLAEPAFGIDTAMGEHYRLAGPLCAIWLLLFVAPFFLWARDGGTPGAKWGEAVKGGAVGLWTTLRRASDNKNILKYLGARMLYADGMAALLALGATYTSLFLGWNLIELTAYAILGSAFAFIGGIVGGYLDNRFGPKRALIIEITGMLITLLFQLSITRESMFFGLLENTVVWDGPVFETVSDIVYLSSIAFLAVTATASISSSRSLLVFLAPPKRVGEFFGLFAIAGTVTVWLGPLLVEVFATSFNSQRAGMAAISILFLGGLCVLLTVEPKRPDPES
ncbi:MAG: MFS transporter [Hyphomonadaceae bacterium]|nr:MFS transporter [Hyphomonadaceae bacterium]